MIRVLLFHDTAIAGHHGCSLVNARIDELARRHALAIQWRGSSLKEMKRLNCNDFDLLLVNGEGALHRNTRMAMQIAAAIDWAKDNGLRCALINTIFEDNSSEIAQSVS
ncbi:MAG: hypothetical protein AAFU56_06235, partial [Pseudomonadota bacterium]